MTKSITLKFLCSCIAATIFVIGAASCATATSSTIKGLGVEQNQQTNNSNSNDSPTNN